MYENWLCKVPNLFERTIFGKQTGIWVMDGRDWVLDDEHFWLVVITVSDRYS